MRKDGTIPRSIGDFVLDLRTMMEDVEMSKEIESEEYIDVIATAAQRSGYRFKIFRGGLEKKLTEAVDDEMEIDLNLDGLVVDLWRCNTPSTRKRVNSKEVAAKKKAKEDGMKKDGEKK